MASKLSDNNGRKNTTLLIGIGVVVMIVALVVVTYPPGSDGLSGTIGCSLRMFFPHRSLIKAW